MAILVGTASWAEKTLIDCGRFYPPEAKTPEARLRYYASIFPLVEVDSSFYAIPTPTVVHNWAARTPDDFVMNVKAFRLFTGHTTEAKVLGKAARELIGNRQRLMYKNAGQELQDFLWQQFYDTLAPLRALGKLGLIHFQFPPSVIWAPKSIEHVEHCIERMRGDTVSIEFRHKSWWETTERTASTLAWLREIRAVHTVVDGPQGADNSVPAVWEVTHPDYALLRLHGRNQETYNAPAETPAERFDYEYSEAELTTLAGNLVRVAENVQRTHAVFNNCNEDKGQRNAIDFMGMTRASE